ncbi:MAG: replicative DNA helicase [Rhodospirillales bacterium]|nr:replicative DNA helicase [Rhodospirillales bacterium]
MESNVARLRPEGGEPSYRTPPANIEAEQALLGAILVNNAAYHRVSEFLLPEHFAEAVHGRIYDAIRTLIERGQIANPVTLKGVFDQDNALAEIGGSAYLGRLAASVITIINAEDYGRTIYDLYLRRQLITLGEEVVNSAYTYDLELDAAAQIETAEKKLFDLAEKGISEGGFQAFQHSLANAILQAEAAFKRSGKTAGVSTGFTDLDRLLGGLHPSDLVILAGRPSMGKTALATNIAFNAAKLYRPKQTADGRIVAEDGAVVGFFSLEMSAEQLAARVLAEESGVSGDRIRRGDVSHDDFDKFVQASQRLASVPLYIDDTPALSIAALRTRARRLKRQHGLDLIVVDYLQLLQGAGSGRSAENRVQEISEITRGLKAIAKELDVPVIALSQLSRAVEQREDKRPQLADLRESGSIEQDADVVMFVFREEYYLARAEPMRRPEESEEKFNDRYERWKARLEEVHATAEVIISKQRHGPIGTVRLRFDGETTKFDNLVSDDRLPSHR